MTTRLAGFVVTLERDMREDDAQSTIDAIRHIKGVLSVTTVEGGIDIAIGEERARAAIIARLWDVVRAERAK